MSDLTSSPELFDSRDVIERIEELEAVPTIDREPDDQEELDALYALQDDAECLDDWEHGATFIRDDYFSDYVEELLKEVGYIPGDLPSWVVIDWDETADNMQADYTDFEFMGTTYWARSV